MTCLVCMCNFEKHHHKQKFCSNKCYVINHRRLARERWRSKHGFNPRPERCKTHYDDFNQDVRMELVKAMKAKYASIDINEEIDKWIGGIK